MKSRPALSLLEVLICVAIVSLVATELAVMFVGLFQLQKEHLWNAELSDRLRAARERVLFHAVSPGDNYAYGGLLSATNVVWSGGQLAATFPRTLNETVGGYDTANKNAESRRYAISKMDNGDKSVTTDDGFVTNDLVFLSVSVEVDGSNRVERLSVPLFGKEGSNLWAEFMQATEDNCGNTY